MKVVGISCTPRKGGNTEYLIRECLDEFIEKGWTVSEFFLSEKPSSLVSAVKLVLKAMYA